MMNCFKMYHSKIISDLYILQVEKVFTSVFTRELVKLSGSIRRGKYYWTFVSDASGGWM